MLTAEEMEKIESIYPPNYPNRGHWLGNMYCYGRQFDKAIEQYEALISNPRYTGKSVYDDLATLYGYRGEISKALETLEKYVQREPGQLSTIVALVRKCNIRIQMSDLTGAWQEWKRAAEIDSWKGDSITCHARLLEVEGNAEEAIEEARRNAERYPDDSSYSNLGWTCYRLGDLDQAMNVADEALRRWPNQSPYRCYWLKSEILRRQGRSEEARRLLEQYLASSPNTVYPYRALGQYHLATGNYGLAIETIEKGMPYCIMEDYRSVRSILVYALIFNGEYERAEKEIDFIECLAPLNDWPGNMRAWIALNQKEPEKSLRLLEYGLNSFDYEALRFAACAWLDLGQPEKALHFAQKSIDISMYPSDHSLLIKGMAARELGDVEEARKAWQACIESRGPDGVYAKEAAELLAQL